MHDDNLSNWNPNVLNSSPLFKPLRALQPFMDQHQQAWPRLEDYQKLLRQNVPKLRSDFGSPLKFVAQGGKPVAIEDQYEARIYLKGEIQTRLKNWHDFFQVLVWCTFPKTKVSLNYLHYTESQTRAKDKTINCNRGPLENTIALFDECGSIIVSCEEELLNLIRNFKWKKLFIEHSKILDKHLRCFVFGHAMYDKALNPYIGMTSPAVLLLVEPDYFLAPLSTQLEIADQRVAELFNSKTAITSPKDLQPFPLLGMPGWYNGHQTEAFYSNTRYFRMSRGQK